LGFTRYRDGVRVGRAVDDRLEKGEGSLAVASPIKRIWRGP
jgi:hypothetical protein